MDSLTQAVLGAAVFCPLYIKMARAQTTESPLRGDGGVVMRGCLIGAILGTLPDLDVFIPLGDPVTDFVSHRGPSHSIIMHVLAAPLLAFALLWLDPLLCKRDVKKSPRTDSKMDLSRFAILSLGVYLTLATHALLDAFTVYGTQIFWPFGHRPASWSTIFIIDPLYTVPLLAAVVIALRRSFKGQQASAKPFYAGLGISSLYLLWTLCAKIWVEQQIRHHIDEQGREHSGLLITPSPFNTLLWRAVALVPGGYLETYYSLIAPSGLRPRFDFYPSDDSLLHTLQNKIPAEQLQWFTHGFYSVQLANGRVHMTDLRMGSEPSYVFSFDLGRPGHFDEPKQIGMRPNQEDLKSLFSRFFTH